MQLSPPAVVRLGPNEQVRLRTLRLRALEDAPDAFGSTLAETAARPPESWAQQLADLPTWVAVADGVDVGMVRTAPDRDDPQRAWLISMWVAPGARGCGVGDALVAAAVAWAAEAGRRDIALDVAVDNAPAIGLYRRHGFVETGRTSRLAAPREHVVEGEMVRGLG